MLSKIIQGTRCFTYDEYQIPERPNPFIFNILCQPVNEKKTQLQMFKINFVYFCQWTVHFSSFWFGAMKWLFYIFTNIYWIPLGLT